MAKKHKRPARKAKKSAKQAIQTVSKHKPLSAALVALGTLASSVLASEKIQSALQDLVSGIIARATSGLKLVSEKAGEALPALGDGSDEGEEEHAHA